MAKARFLPNHLELSVKEKIWIAAVIDCEGTLSIHLAPNKQPLKRGKPISRHLLYVCRVNMVNEAIPKTLQYCFFHRLKADGSVSPAKIREAHGRVMPLCGCGKFGKK